MASTNAFAVGIRPLGTDGTGLRAFTLASATGTSAVAGIVVALSELATPRGDAAMPITPSNPTGTRRPPQAAAVPVVAPASVGGRG